jgi:2-iminobutanoate/2-iminopropanoate deaminase
LVAVFGLSYLLTDTRAGQGESNKKGGGMKREAMEREIIRVEPFDTNFKKWGVPVSVCTRAGNMVFVSGMPPFDPETGELAANAPFERQAELVLTQMKTAPEAAGSDLDHVLKCNAVHLQGDRFKTFNEIYSAFPDQSAGPKFSSACRNGPPVRHRDRLYLRSRRAETGEGGPPGGQRVSPRRHDLCLGDPAVRPKTGEIAGCRSTADRDRPGSDEARLETAGASMEVGFRR